MTPPDEPRSERSAALATVGGVLAIVLVVVAANLLGRAGGDDTGPEPAPAPVAAERTSAAELATMSPQEIARESLEDRGRVALQSVPSGGRSLASSAEKIANRAQPFDFVLTTFNILGSQHTAPGGPAAEFAPGRLRTEWAAGLLASYGSSVVGLQELQRDQLAALARATGGRFDFWPGTALGSTGVPQSLMWDTGVWKATYTGSITVPFMGGTRPQPIARLQHLETGREVYVLNVHNSPRDRQGREDERDKAEAIEVEAVKELRKDGIPVLLVGDFNEHEEAFCTFTGRAGMQAANGGSHTGGSCRPPRPMRVDWIFGSTDVEFSGFLMDTGPLVRRITDHAVLSSTVTVP